MKKPNFKPIKCQLCGKEFTPRSARQKYCDDDHYGPCPVCGKPVKIKEYYIGPQACSPECRVARIAATCEEKYGNACVINSEHGRELSKKTCMEKYGVDHASKDPETRKRMESTTFARYGVKHAMQSPEIRARATQTNMERYGGPSPSSSPEVKAKSLATNLERYGGIGLGSPVLRPKIIETNRRKYGVDFSASSPEVQTKMQRSKLDKYGTLGPAAVPELRAKIEATNLKKYGVKWIFQDPDVMAAIQEKAKKTMIERYGVENASHSPELVAKANATMIERYGVPYYVMTEECSNHNRGKLSKLNMQVLELIQATYPDAEPEKYIHRYSFDIFIPSKNILIEIDPTATHNSHRNMYHTSDPGYHPMYHMMKSKIGTDKGYRCIHMYDWTTLESVLYACEELDQVQLESPVLHWYNDNTDDHIIDVDCEYDKMISKGYLPVYDDGLILTEAPGLTLHDIRLALYT